MPASEQTRRRLSALTSHLGSVGCASAADAEFRVSPAPTSDVYFTNASSKKDIELPSSLRVKVSRLNPDLPPPPEPLPKDAPEVKANPWHNELAMLEYRRKLGTTKFAPEKDPGVVRQAKQGKLLVRDRVNLLIDAGSLREHGTIAGRVVYDEDGKIIDWTPSNFIAGRASVRGRPIMFGADDFTVRGGHQDGHVGGKQMYAERLARQYRVPMVRMLDGSSGGGSVASILKNGFSSLPMLMGFEHLVRMLDEVPVAAAALGPTVGLASARGTTCHFTVGTTIPGVSQLFAAGPPVVLHATHEVVTKDQLGGARMQASTGTFDNLADTEAGAIEMIKDWLSYLPSNRWELPPINPKPSPEEMAKVDWDSIVRAIPNDRKRPYNPRDYLNLIVDPGTLFEIGPYWGKAQGTFFARINGKPVAITASDPRYDAGALTDQSCNKLSRFIGVCSTFHLPILNFVDCPGFLVGTKAEKLGTVRAGSRLACLMYESQIPFWHCVVRKGYGVATGVLLGHQNTDFERGGTDAVYAWPSAEAGGVPVEGGVEAAFKRDLENIKDPIEREKEAKRIQVGIEGLHDRFRTAEHFGFQELLDFRETRKYVEEWVEIIYRTRLPEIITRDSALKTGGGAWCKFLP